MPPRFPLRVVVYDEDPSSSEHTAGKRARENYISGHGSLSAGSVAANVDSHDGGSFSPGGTQLAGSWSYEGGTGRCTNEISDNRGSSSSHGAGMGTGKNLSAHGDWTSEDNLVAATRAARAAAAALVSASSSQQIVQDAVEGEGGEGCEGAQIEILEEAAAPSAFSPERAFFLFSLDSCPRNAAIKLATNVWFERFVLSIILLNCLFLVVSDPLCMGVGPSLPPSNATCTRASLHCTVAELEAHPCFIFCSQWISRRPGYRCNPITQMAADRSEIIFQALFTFEMLVSMLAKGLVLHPHSYLRDAWGIIDFVVVSVGWIGIIPGVSNFSFLRFMRVLRPLRTMNRIPGLQPLLASLFNALRMLLNVMGLFAFVFLLFGIMGVQMMTGALRQRCVFAEGDFINTYSEPTPFGSLEHLCSAQGRECPPAYAPNNTSVLVPTKCATHYRPADTPIDSPLIRIPNPEYTLGIISFDNVFSGFLAIFQVIAIEGWADLFQQYSEAWNTVLAHIYFTLLIILGSWFVINLALAVISDSFSKAAGLAEDDRIREEVAIFNRDNVVGSPLDIEAARKAIARQKKEKEAYCIPSMEGTIVVRFCHALISSKQFQSVIMFLIIGNVGLLALDYFEEDIFRRNWLDLYFNRTSTLTVVNHHDCEKDQWGYPVTSQPALCGALINVETGMVIDSIPAISTELSEMLVLANYALTAIFTLEVLLKLVALGFREYAKDRFNLFDAVVVVASLIEIIVGFLSSGSGTSILSVFRVLRLFRVFKLARSWESLRKVLGMLIASAQSLVSLLIILGLFVFIFSLMGMQLFGGGYRFRQPDVIGSNPRFNFDGFLPDTGPEAGYGAVITIFQVLTGDSWNLNMYSAMGSTNAAAFAFFWCLILFGNFVIMNLFVAVLLNGASLGGQQDVLDGEDEEEAESPSTKSTLFKKLLKRLQTPKKPPPPPPAVKSVSVTAFDDDCSDSDESDVDNAQQYNSLRCLAPNNMLRSACVRLVESSVFTWFILFCIIVSSLTMVVENPKLDDDDIIMEVIRYLDTIFLLIFVCELLIKIIALGLFLHEGSYLRDPWNRLDLFIVVVSVVPLLFSGNPALSRQIRVFRLRIFRVLRPLRMLKRNPGMKLVVNCLLQSIPAMMNVVFVILLIFVTFGIMGMQFFKGLFYVCKAKLEPIRLDYAASDFLPDQDVNTTYAQMLSFLTAHHSDAIITQRVDAFGELHNITNWYDCTEGANGVWVQDPQHFDNIMKAMLTLFQLATLDSWARVMDLGLDSAIVPGQLPSRMAKPPMVLFFVGFLFIGSFFVINLFVGVVFENYVKLQQSAEGSIMTESQKQWVTTTRALMRTRPVRKILPPNNKFRAKVLALVQHEVFERVVMVLIVLNILVMASNIDSPSEGHQAFLKYSGFVFMAVFVLECVLKNIGMSPREYFKENWNRFDFLVVIASIIGSFDFASETLVLQVLRVFRVFKLLRVAKGLFSLITILISSIPSLVNVGALLFLIVYVYSIIGVQLFWNVRLNGPFNDHTNFQDFRHAFFTLFRVTTFYGWSAIMNEAARGVCGTCTPLYLDTGRCESGCGGIIPAYIFFVSFVMLSVFVMLNLFIAIILDNFTLEMGGVDDRLGNQSLLDFASIWSELDVHTTLLLPQDQLSVLLRRLPPPLGCGEDASKKEILSLIEQLHLEAYDGSLLYDDVFHALAHRVSGCDLPAAVAQKLNKTRGRFSKAAFKKHIKKTASAGKDSLEAMMARAKGDKIELVIAAQVIQRAWRSHRLRVRFQEFVINAWKLKSVSTPARHRESEWIIPPSRPGSRGGSAAGARTDEEAECRAPPVIQVSEVSGCVAVNSESSIVGTLTPKQKKKTKKGRRSKRKQGNGSITGDSADNYSSVDGNSVTQQSVSSLGGAFAFSDSAPNSAVTTTPSWYPRFGNTETLSRGGFPEASPGSKPQLEMTESRVFVPTPSLDPMAAFDNLLNCGCERITKTSHRGRDFFDLSSTEGEDN